MVDDMSKTPPRSARVRRSSKPQPPTQQQQNARHAPPRAKQAARQLPAQPHNAGDLRGLLRQYGNVLTPQNRQLLQDVIVRLERGDVDGLRGIAANLQKQLGKS